MHRTDVKTTCVEYAAGLLANLQSLVEARSRIEAWPYVEDCIEPIDVLHSTIRHWRELSPADPDVAFTADILLLLPDPELLCDRVQETLLTLSLLQKKTS